MTWQATSFKVGDRHPDILAARSRLKAIANKLVAGRLDGETADEFTPAFATVYGEWLTAVHGDVTKGRRPGPDVKPAQTSIDWAAKVQLGLIPRNSAPPVLAPPAPPRPSGPRHAGLMFRGTGGVIGLDYVSRVCQGAADLVEEINPNFPASMGGFPPGAPGTPSGAKAVEIGVASGRQWIEANPTRSFLLGGYSLGAIVSARLRAMLEPGGELARHRDRFVAGFSFGDPARPFGGSYYLGPVPGGVGISSWRAPASVIEARWCWCTHPDDMYGNIPVPVSGGTGDIMETVFDMVTEASLSDFMGMVTAMIPHLLEIANDAGVLGALGGGGGVGSPTTNPLGGLLGGLGGGGLGGLGGLLGGAGGLGGLGDIATLLPALLGGGALLMNPVTIIPTLLPLFTAAMPGLIAGIGGGVGGNLTGPAAAAQAAIIAMKFLMTGTAAHINYHAWEVWPGQTYLGLAIQHVRDWASRTPVRS